MKQKQRVYFVAPRKRGWAFFYSLNIFQYLQKNHRDTLDVYFCNSFFDFIKLHFTKSDYIFSIIPFFFKPFFNKTYIYNLHGNFKTERKKITLWTTLLYLSEWNLYFSDSILLTSLYLSEVLHFRKYYESKIMVAPNFVKEKKNKKPLLRENDFKFLTITSFDFAEKSKGVISLLQVIQELWARMPHQEISFTIVWSNTWKYYGYIYDHYRNMTFSPNIEIFWKWWLDSWELEKEFLNHNNFLYWSFLDNTPGVILEAMNYNRNIYVNDFPSFYFFLSPELICKNQEEMIQKIMKNTQASDTYTIPCLQDVWKQIYTFIQKN